VFHHFEEGRFVRPTMVHVLETGLEFLANENPNGKPSVQGYNIINGQLTSASDGATFTSINPAILNDTLGSFPLSTKADVHAALDAAHAAFPGWAATPAPTRGQIIGNMGRLLMDHKDAIVALETR
jgi:delta 1-pyrroline-5-carboxylate dehydrogenase